MKLLTVALICVSGCVIRTKHPGDCYYEPIPASAWRAAAYQLGVHVGDLAEGVYGVDYNGGGRVPLDERQMCAPLTSQDVISHGHLKAITLDDGSPGVEIARLTSKPVHIGDLQPGETKTIYMRSPVSPR